MQVKHFHSWLKVFSEQALLHNERRLVVLSGDESWALGLLNNRVFFPEKSIGRVKEECLIYGDSELFSANVSPKRFRDKLGSESSHFIFADSQFRIDALAALSGTIKAGGMLFIVMPELTLQKIQSPFIQRFFNLLDTMPAHAFITEAMTEPLVQLSTNEMAIRTTEHIKKATLSLTSHELKQNDVIAYGCATAEQLAAVKAIEKVVTGHRKRPLVLTADRGRGKSSALAIACAQLLMKASSDNQLHIIVTAPDKQSLSVFFKQLLISLPEISHRDNCFFYADSCIEFVPVDQLLKNQPKASLLLVDEAAAIPVYLLEQLLTFYHRMVFSSTVHGYEGAGRGFTLKFQQTLTKVCPHWRALHMREPIRWRLDDPLEQFIFDTCLLNSELESITFEKSIFEKNTCGSSFESPREDKKNAPKVNADVMACEVFSAADLMVNEALLKQVFSILVTAHYQTKPSDVKLLLDNPNVQLVCLMKVDHACESSHVVAVALLLKEGLVEDVEAIKNGQRRLKNHFLPQSLLTHCGFEAAFNYGYLRIMRIAVHPQIQQQGIGRNLLAHIEQLASKQKIDFIGASFGLNPALLSFWLTAGMKVTRIGFTKDKASGEHSVMVLKAVNTKLAGQLNQLNDEFCRSFDFLLADEYKALSAELVLLLLKKNKTSQTNDAKKTVLTSLDLANVYAFAQGHRLYSNCAYSLHLWLKEQLFSDKPLESVPALLALISRSMQKHSIDELCQQYSYTGKKMLEQRLKDYVQQRLTIIAKDDCK
jgi:tRNA(Met) cytidine acetyltransferase